jgi:lipopolysaccharide transport system ATP-binding protein
MTDTVITVENLSKAYLVGHISERRFHYYTALRDVVTHGVQDFARKAADMLRGRQIVQGDEIEEFWALKDVSFEVKQGEVIGIIGRNGAGKSTLLKILSRITEPTRGRIMLRGRVASLLEVGTGFHPELTGRENIFLNGAILGMTQSEIRRKFDEIVAFAEIEKFLDTPVKRYSSGMYVRLAFAVAAHLEPEILIIDEVLAVGDAEFQRKCLGKMQDVASREGRTILFVSHNHAAIRSLCSHAFVLRSGIASTKKDVASALDDYTSEWQASLPSAWRRPALLAKRRSWFEEIKISLLGAQPNHKLECRCDIVCEAPNSPVFISVDFIDRNLGAIMQAEPNPQPFIGFTPGKYRVDLTIDLPPLVPGIYWLNFWVGPHNTHTHDDIKQAVAIEIVDNPTPQRIYPYTPNHGSVVPISRVEVVRLDRNDSEDAALPSVVNIA